MAEGFLARYNDELAALRRRASRFAEQFPKIAGRLRLGDDVADDPHVERLVQSFAYSAARVRQKLDDELPELTDGLLETLYPHYLAPIPSMSIVRFQPADTLATLSTVPRHAEMLAEPISGEACRFRTSQPVEIAPVTLESAALLGLPLKAPQLPAGGAAACLRLTVRTNGNAGVGGIETTGLKRLRFHVASPWRKASALLELIVNHAVGVALARHADDPDAIFMPADAVRQAGFAEDETILPYPASSFVGYRLLTEFFAFPQKFLFFDVFGLDRFRGEKLDIYIYLDEADQALERSVEAADFELFATPVVNLFRQACEPIVIDGTRTEYRLLPDSRRQHTREIYAVDSVRLSARRGGDEVACEPFFSRSLRGKSGSIYWQTSRRFDADDRTGDIDIAFVDEGRHALGPRDLVASIDAVCLNRDLPTRLPFGGGHPRLQLASGHEAVGGLAALSPPTQPIRLVESEGRAWRLMSHLQLNHLSLFDRDGGALKDILSLYAFRDAPETKLLIDSICGLDARPSTARLANGGMVPGLDIAVDFDPATIDRPSAYLFGAILDRFFSLYASINSFTRLTVSIKGRSSPVARWPARAADRPLL